MLGQGWWWRSTPMPEISVSWSSSLKKPVWAALMALAQQSFLSRRRDPQLVQHLLRVGPGKTAKVADFGFLTEPNRLTDVTDFSGAGLRLQHHAPRAIVRVVQCLGYVENRGKLRACRAKDVEPFGASAGGKNRFQRGADFRSARLVVLGGDEVRAFHCDAELLPVTRLHIRCADEEVVPCTPQPDIGPPRAARRNLRDIGVARQHVDQQAHSAVAHCNIDMPALARAISLTQSR